MITRKKGGKGERSVKAGNLNEDSVHSKESWSLKVEITKVIEDAARVGTNLNASLNEEKSYTRNLKYEVAKMIKTGVVLRFNFNCKDLKLVKEISRRELMDMKRYREMKKEFQKPEKSLKETCEEFIMAVTMLIVDPMLSFVTKVTTVKVSLYSAGQNQRVDSVMGKPLMEQAFATPDKVVELVQKVKHRHSASVASGDGEDETLSAESFYTNNSFQTCKVSLKS
ncbi:hypothetical protein LWI28_013704 [Acer negundo]|uniref:Uncharacterized protein n=1 Tax=Acer negundo TaxID=4023 RepID=A0AAD5JBF9_ACENE|nr:hypothetical protein LWI28_013704 [Acer negundo]